MSLLIFAIFLTLITALLLHFDDLFFDLNSFFRGAKPEIVSSKISLAWKTIPQRKIAILIPTWKSDQHLEKMILGNLARLQYENFSLFLGVYIEDIESYAIARKLENKFSQISVVLVKRDEKNNKAKILNEMLRQILKFDRSASKFEAFFLTDSDETLHPLTLQYLNNELEKNDFVNIPLLSEKENLWNLANGTYADELAEQLLRDIPLRNKLQATSSGFLGGIALSRTLLKALNSGSEIFSETNLAETYHLSLRVTQLGFQSSSRSIWLEETQDYLTNKKYFPIKANAAAQQKSRLTLGIAFQGAITFGWLGKFWNRYFLWRDRRGPWTTLFLALASLLVILSVLNDPTYAPILPSWMETISICNFALWLRRVSFRMYSTSKVYGFLFALLVPIRYPVGNFINSISTWRALSQWKNQWLHQRIEDWQPKNKKIPQEFLSLKI
jgi:bacteriophage N4 adsorption protein B